MSEPETAAWCRSGTVEGRPLTESELIDRAKRGDAEAYEHIVQAHQGIAFRIAYLVTGDAGDAEEAAQDGFVKAFRALDRFRPGAPFRPWLLEIVANEARNRRRSAARRTKLALRQAAESVSGGAAPSPEATLLDTERRSELLEAVNELREEERLVIACRYFLDLSEAETAAALGIRKGTVKSRTARALEHLRGRLEVAHA
jgi:RNA polymerase sigma-70 factor (ECF subfamily)